VKKKQQWREMTPRQRTALVLLGVIEVNLALAAWTDLARRPPTEVRGSKRCSAAVIAINVVGPLAYFWWGRLPVPPPALALAPFSTAQTSG
jgi:hypothetical protein